MKYYLISIDTNGIPYRNNFDKVDLVSISLVEIDFLELTENREPISFIVSGVDVKDTTQYHGMTWEIVDEYGTELEEVVTEVLNYIFQENDVVDFSKITLIGANVDKFILPVLNKTLKSFEINISSDIKTFEITHCSKLLFNCDSFNDALDVFGLQLISKDSYGKLYGALHLLRRMRGSLSNGR